MECVPSSASSSADCRFSITKTALDDLDHGLKHVAVFEDALLGSVHSKEELQPSHGEAAWFEISVS